jgi:hypothetical protein
MRMPLPVLVLAFLASFGCKGKQEATASAPSAPPAQYGGSATGAPVAPAARAGGSAAPDAGATRSLPGDAQEDSLFFALERTPCFGRCPTYKARINDDGTATYEGIRSVDREGRYTGHVDRAFMEALYARATAIRFFDLKDRYDSEVTDLPSTIIHINAHGQDKQVVGRVGTPQPFKAFAAYADSLLATVAWTKVEGAK